jgi:hypothetical protein
MLVHLALSSPKGHTVVARRGVDSAPCTNPRPTAFSTRVAHFKRPLPLVQPSSPLPTAFLHPRRDTIALSPPPCRAASDCSSHCPSPLAHRSRRTPVPRSSCRSPRRRPSLTRAIVRRHPLDEPPCQSKSLPCWWVGALLTLPSCASPPQSHRQPSHQPPPPEFSTPLVRSASSHRPVIPMGSQGNGFA